ncbi:MAG: translation initiation factor IF-2 [Cystobacterineae bacterium]|nr:translation initiation factor IF-2 [Cystobacterineae bacterium]
MSKKRVHEIAKELRSQGIELDNKDVVQELVSLGYEVRSHSSSLEDDQAAAAIQRILDKRRPKPTPTVATKGFVVRRRAGEEVVSVVIPETKAQDILPPPRQAFAMVEPSAQPEHARKEELETQPKAVASTPPLAAKKQEETASDTPSLAQETVPLAPQPSLPPVPESPAPEKKAVTLPPMLSAMEGVATETQPLVSERKQVFPAQPSLKRPMHERTQAPTRAEPLQTARPHSKMGAWPHAAPSASSTTAQGEGRALRPTATQAVIVNRPLIQIKRPVATPGGRYSGTPNRRPADSRELKPLQQQTPAAPGRIRETVDVLRTKEKERPKRGRTGEKDTGAVQQDIREFVFGRPTTTVRVRKKKQVKRGQRTPITEMSEDKKIIRLQQGITVSDLSQRMGVKVNELIKRLMQTGSMVTANQMIDVERATQVASAYGWKVEKVGFEVEDFLGELDINPEDIRPRPPVVTVMGHVDHGKTSLLDAIRSANVARGEAGGITQHIGAYTVSTLSGDVTFLDTPGHEAFSAMRERGANITDVVVLVVAADDGVMPQTKEAISHAKAAEVPIVVAINKMDLPTANPDRIKKELADLELIPEDWGGQTITVPVSAKARQGIDLLLENILLQAEILELSTNPNRPAIGTVLEAKLEKGRGPVATVLIQEGTLRQGDALVTGTHHGRVRIIRNDRSEMVKEVFPGYSAEVVGLSGVPTAGEALHVVADEKVAKEIAAHRLQQGRASEIGKTATDSLEALLGRMQQSETKELKVILKADVAGSLEAIVQSVEKLSSPKVKVTIVQQGVGMITETDMNTAAALKAVVIGFNSKPESGAEAAAKTLEVEHASYSIIYELLDGVLKMMENLLEPIRMEKKLGRAEVRNVFNVPRLGVIAGSAVTEGLIRRGANIRLWRESKQLYVGKITSLKRFKDDVREVASGFECGIGIEGAPEMVAGDAIEVFEIEEIRPSLH